MYEYLFNSFLYTIMNCHYFYMCVHTQFQLIQGDLINIASFQDHTKYVVCVRLSDNCGYFGEKQTKKKIETIQTTIDNDINSNDIDNLNTSNTNHTNYMFLATASYDKTVNLYQQIRYKETFYLHYRL